MGGPELIVNYRAYFELSTRRVDELRAVRELSEAEIVDRGSAELPDHHPDWENRNGAMETMYRRQRPITIIVGILYCERPIRTQ